MQNRLKIFLVDDDALFLKSLEVEFLQETDFDIKTFSTGELCLDNLSYHPDIVILDYFLAGIDKTAMNGIETLDKIKSLKSDIEVVMLSSQDKIDVAVSCMHHGAFDYVVKSETAFHRLKKIILNILKTKKTESELKWYMERM
jgi:DNA-binding NtrC family response regulator